MYPKTWPSCLSSIWSGLNLESKIALKVVRIWSINNPKSHDWIASTCSNNLFNIKLKLNSKWSIKTKISSGSFWILCEYELICSKNELDLVSSFKSFTNRIKIFTFWFSTIIRKVSKDCSESQSVPVEFVPIVLILAWISEFFEISIEEILLIIPISDPAENQLLDKGWLWVSLLIDCSMISGVFYLLFTLSMSTMPPTW